MSATVKIVFDSSYLRDVLVLDGVAAKHTRRSENSQVGRVEIPLDKDFLVDEMIEVLTKLQRDAAKRRLEGNVERLMQQQGDAIKSRQQRHNDWLRAEAHLSKVQTELSAAMQELDALTAQEGS